MVQTDRLGFPLLVPGQAQKELTHNEALTIADLAIQLTVERADLATPPGTPTIGRCWIVATGGTGAWLDRDGSVAGWTATGWIFLMPGAGWRAWDLDREAMILFDGTAWVEQAMRADGVYLDGDRIVGARLPAIANAVGGAVQDVEARVAIGAVLAALRSHGLIES